MLDWLKIIPQQALHRWREFPFLGRSPQFDWDDLRARLQQRSGFAQFQVKESSLQWQSDPLGGFGENCASFGLAGFPGRILGAISSDHLETLFAWLLGDPALADTSLREAFWRFFLLQSLDLIQTVEPLKDIGLVIKSVSERNLGDLSKEPALCCDVIAAKEEQAIVLRLIFDAEFIQGWKLHWQSKERVSIDPKAAADISLPLQLISDQIALLPSQLRDLQVGDWVRLESQNLEQGPQNTDVILRLSGFELGKGVLKDQMITVQECATSPFTAAQQTPQE